MGEVGVRLQGGNISVQNRYGLCIGVLVNGPRMKSILFLFWHHIGIFYALSVGDG